MRVWLDVWSPLRALLRRRWLVPSIGNGGFLHYASVERTDLRVSREVARKHGMLIAGGLVRVESGLRLRNVSGRGWSAAILVG